MMNSSFKKEAGVFYTPVDAARYILRNTLYPYIFDAVQAQYPEAFGQDATAWKLLSQNPDRYIFSSIQTGVNRPLPPEIEAGNLNPDQREGWNRLAQQGFGLPGETWREVAARRKAYAGIRKKLVNDEIRQSDDFIIFNLDLARFIEDLLENSLEPELLEAFASTVEQTTILDPTCGEGVFLLEALAMLGPLYELCLEGMASYIEHDRLQQKAGLYPGFEERLERTGGYSSLPFYAHCYIAGNNLFGMDIMPGAVETARQRLHTQLLCRQHSREDAAALLPSLEDNLRVGDFLACLPEEGWNYPRQATRFAVVAGNPPYVELDRVENLPDIIGMQTTGCGNLYPLVLERSIELCRTGGRMGMVIPLGAFATIRMEPLQDLLLENFSPLALSFYSAAGHPGVLFEEVKYRLAILLGKRHVEGERQVFTSAYLRWQPQERPFLFDKITYRQSTFTSGPLRFARLGSEEAGGILEKMLAKKELLRSLVKRGGKHSIYYQRGPVYWVRVTDFVPFFEGGGRTRSESHLGELRFEDHETSFAAGSILSSSFFYLWFISQGNCRDLIMQDALSFPVGSLPPDLRLELARAFFYLVVDLREHAGRGSYRSEGGGRVEFDRFYPRLSRQYIETIDRLLARHYGLTPAELDFLLNYDIKYRVEI